MPATEERARWIRADALFPAPLLLGRSQLDDLEARARAAHPREACGLLIGRETPEATLVLRVEEARNTCGERANDRYVLAPEDHLRIETAARAEGFEVVGVWHSHPDQPARPSLTDREAAWEGWSYLIIQVTAHDVRESRAWRLVDGAFTEQRIREQA
jgi:proteasome lid subunit RPN8/RPN11